MKTPITILIYASIVQGFYMALLLNHNQKRNVANRYLAVLLAAMSLSVMHSVFVTPEIHKTLNDPFRIKEPFLMLVIPLIWLYVKKLDMPNFKPSIKVVLHFLPFLVFMSVNIPAYLHGSESLFARFLTFHSTGFNGILWLALLVQYSLYLVQIVKITRRYKQKAQKELSNIEYVDVSWLTTFLYAFILVFVLLALTFASSVHHFGVDWMNQLVCLVFSIAIFVLGFKGLFQQSIFSNANAQEVPEPITEEQTKLKWVDESLSTHLQQYMDEYKPHRDMELTLTSLAKLVGMSRNQLSEVINTSLGCNFYDFVNRYRVEDVKQLMLHPKFKDFTLLAIAYEAGFPSKSTFNSIFKKFTGLTPSEYRNSLS